MFCLTEREKKDQMRVNFTNSIKGLASVCGVEYDLPRGRLHSCRGPTVFVRFEYKNIDGYIIICPVIRRINEVEESFDMSTLQLDDPDRVPFTSCHYITYLDLAASTHQLLEVQKRGVHRSASS
tara:strand:- start:150 stop:521 length:372 start_codon:yes stop_codon:yes gene_type:complete